jgi:hypothetical protein
MPRNTVGAPESLRYASAFLNSASLRAHPFSAASALWFCPSGGIQPWFAPLYTSICRHLRLVEGLAQDVLRRRVVLIVVARDGDLSRPTSESTSSRPVELLLGLRITLPRAQWIQPGLEPHPVHEQ